MRSNLLALFAGCVVAVYVTAQSFTPTDVAWIGAQNVAVTGGGESYVFTNGYEDSFTSWTSENDSASNLSVSDAQASEGTNSCQFEMDSATAAYIQKTLDQDYSDIYVSCYVRLNDVTAVDTAGGNYWFLSLFDVAGLATNTFKVGFRANADPWNATHFRIWYYSDAGSQLPLASAVTIAADTWYKVTAYWKNATGEGANDGIVKAWFDGDLIFDVTNADSDLKPGVGQVRVGSNTCEWSLDQGIYAWFDDVKVGEGAPTDP